MSLTPDTRYARNGSIHLAYQTFGGGELDIVLVPGFISHVEMGWEHPPRQRPLGSARHGGRLRPASRRHRSRAGDRGR